MKAVHIIRKLTIMVIIAMQVIFFPAAALAQDAPAPVSDPAASSQPQAVTPATSPAITPASNPPANPPATNTAAPTPPPQPVVTQTAQPVVSPVAPAPQQPVGSSSTQGPTSPTGASSSTYKYNEATGKWENGLYSWDPATKMTAPLTPQDYSYNPATGKWDSTQWIYDAPSGKYIPNVVSVSNAPTSLASTTNASPLKTSQTAPNNSTQNGPNNNNAVTINGTNSGIFDNFFNAKISNNISSNASTGNAAVTQNTVSGDALSGNAAAMANIVNLLQSSWGLGTGDVSTFVANVDGNVVGDLYIDPSMPSQNINATTNQATNLQIHDSVNGEINNNIKLAADSGNATISKNTSAGDAETGSATAVGNVINLINSHIGASKSFVGMLNINGNLDGDILLPTSFLESLLASSTAPGSNTSLSNNENRSLLANFDNTQTVNNTVTASAVSGNALVDKNTSAGNALTGNASTNLMIFNLTGRQVVAKDAILVFVNVLGKWVGVIVNAPVGSTTAALGGGVTQNNNLAQNAVIDSKVNGTINNNITATAKSGDAALTSNTKAGDAKSGDAKVAVNLLNISDSQLSLGGWFGVLFINVLGTWNGSFGVNTAAGNLKPPALASNVSGAASAAVANSNLPLLAFVPRVSGSGSAASGQSFQFAFGGSTQNTGGGSSDNATQTNPAHGSVLAKSTSPAKSSAQPKPTLSRRTPSGFNWRVPVFGTLTGLVLFGVEQMWSLKRRTA